MSFDKPGIVLRSIRSSAPVCSSRKSCSDVHAHTCSGTSPSRKRADVPAPSWQVWLCHSSGRSRPPWYSLPMPPRSWFTSVVHCAKPQLFMVSIHSIVHGARNRHYYRILVSQNHPKLSTVCLNQGYRASKIKLSCEIRLQNQDSAFLGIKKRSILVNHFYPFISLPNTIGNSVPQGF